VGEGSCPGVRRSVAVMNGGRYPSCHSCSESSCSRW
jgi:hypothetical protein